MAGARVQIIVDGVIQREVDLRERFAIGRSSKSDLVVAHQGVSRRHAEIRDVGAGGHYVFDAGSRNGTYVNGERIVGATPLRHGDRIVVGKAELCYLDEHCEPQVVDSKTDAESTEVGLSGATAVVLVSDIRNYTSMTQRFGASFHVLVAEWFRQAIELIQAHGGRVDKIHGDGMLAYWTVPAPDDPSAEVDASLRTARELLTRMQQFRTDVAALRDEGDEGDDDNNADFDIGIALTLGELSFVNQGSGSVQSFTIVGDCVNVAFRLEALTKEHGRPLLATQKVALWAPPSWRFEDLGEVKPRGRVESIAIAALDPQGLSPALDPGELTEVTNRTP